MDYREITLKDVEYQKALIKKYETELATLPAGGIITREKNGRQEYYHSVPGSNRIYIGKDDEKVVRQLFRRKLLEKTLERMRSNVAVQEKMLTKYLPYDIATVQAEIPASYRKIAALKTLRPGAADGETGEDISDDINNVTRYDAKYDHRTEEGTVIHMTSQGFAVKSKTELMIAEMLAISRISFIYEKAIRLKKSDGRYITVHPDFTFQDRYGREIYWEHFGMLGMEDYREKTMKKLRTYIENNIIPSINLVITAESFDGSLDVSVISRAIEMMKAML